MLNTENFCDVGGLIAAGYSLYQAQQHHKIELQKARERHANAISVAQQQHRKDLVEVKRTYLLELFTNLEQHFQQLNADLISSSKEAERDMFDQRSQSFQTIILASSVMFGALSSAIVEGSLPSSTESFLIIAFSLTSALSFAFLFVSMVVCMELVMRASTFMYRRAFNHTEELRRAINDTKLMMQRLRNGTRNRPSELARARDVADDPQGLLKTHHRAISELDEDALDREWRFHESDLQEFLAERERINDATAVIGLNVNSSQVSNLNKKSFQEFWNESCKSWAELSILFFYAGTVNLLLTLMVFMWAQFLNGYHSFVGAIIAASLITFALVLGVGAVITLRIYRIWIQHQSHSEHTPDGHDAGVDEPQFIFNANQRSNRGREPDESKLVEGDGQIDEEIGLDISTRQPTLARRLF